MTAFTLPAAVMDLLKALPAGAQAILPLGGLLEAAGRWLPLYGLGLGLGLPRLGRPGGRACLAGRQTLIDMTKGCCTEERAAAFVLLVYTWPRMVAL